MATSRKRAWLRDEVVLTLDLYRREGRNVPAAALAEVSDLLRAIPIEAELAADPGFRTPAAVQLKIYNFVSIDPSSTTAGMSAASRLDRQVWADFADDPAGLTAAAAAIRVNLGSMTPAEANAEEPEIEDAAEGAVLTRLHRTRERNAAIVKKRKDKILAEHGALACEGCGFDFGATYGERGDGFIECHHTKPVSSLKPGSRTKLTDLALVCANCHRIIHRRAPWLSVSQLRELLDT